MRIFPSLLSFLVLLGGNSGQANDGGKQSTIEKVSPIKRTLTLEDWEAKDRYYQDWPGYISVKPNDPKWPFPTPRPAEGWASLPVSEPGSNAAYPDTWQGRAQKKLDEEIRYFGGGPLVFMAVDNQYYTLIPIYPKWPTKEGKIGWPPFVSIAMKNGDQDKKRLTNEQVEALTFIDADRIVRVDPRALTSLGNGEGVGIVIPLKIKKGEPFVRYLEFAFWERTPTGKWILLKRFTEILRNRKTPR